MAFEQTINANEKSWLKGIMAFAEISTAVNRKSMDSDCLNEK